MTYRADEMMVRAGRFVDGLKAAGVEFFAAVPVELLYGYYCTDRGRPFCPTRCRRQGPSQGPVGAQSQSESITKRIMAGRESCIVLLADKWQLQ